MSKNWPVVRLDAVATIGAGNSAPQNKDAFCDDGELFIRTSDVGQIKFGEILTSADKLTKDASKGFRRFRAGTVLIPKSGASTFNNHRVITKSEACVSSHLATVTGVQNKVEDRYLWYFLQTVSAQDLIQDQAYPSLSLKQISEIDIPLPPLEEQKRIVSILDQALEHVDALLKVTKKAKKETQALYDQGLVSTFNALMQSEKTIAISEGTSRITNGYVGPIKDVYVDEGIPYLLARHIRNNEMKFDGQTFISAEFNNKNSKSILKVDDVLLVQSGHIGHSAVVDETHVGHNCHALIVLTPIEGTLLGTYLSLFFTYSLAAGNFADLRSGSTVPHLTCKEIRKMQIPIPSVDRQRDVVQGLHALRTEIDQLMVNKNNAIFEFTKLRSSVLSSAFAGDL